MSGKGSAPRPYSVSNEEYANRWDAIFGRDLPKAEPKRVPQQMELFPLCPHDVWTIVDGNYVCMACGLVSKDGIQGV
jgi:hypothetical protein